MYKGNKVILTICARGGSKGVPQKNIRELLGKPLIAYTIEQAKSISWVDRIVVSTEDKEIKQVAEKWGVEIPFFRPKAFASDTCSKTPALIHAIINAEKHWKEKYDLWVDLDPTSPLRSSEDIKEAIKMLLDNNGVTSVITGTESHHNPYFNMVELDNGGFVHLSKKLSKPVVRRQDAPKVYSMNGSVYVMRIKDFLKLKTIFTPKTKLYIMPEDRSVDIDKEVDFKIVELLMKAKLG